MKTFAVLCVGIAIGVWAVVLLSPDDKCLQQQAGYQAVVTTQTNLLQTQIDLLAKEKARAGVLQAAHTALQQELASTLAAKVGKIDDVMEGPVPIAVLAKRMAPVEAAVKEVAKQEGGFIPGAVRGQWAEAFVRILGRGK